MSFNIYLYTNDRVYSVADFVTSLKMSHFVTSPYSQANLSLRVPFDLIEEVLPLKENKVFDISSWLQVYDVDLQTTVFLGRGVSYSNSLDVRSDGLRETTALNIDFECWIAPLTRGQIYLSAKNFGLNGQIFNIQTWAGLLGTTLKKPFTSKDVGATLRALWNEISQYYYFPDALIKGTSFFSVPVVHDKTKALTYAPNRQARFRSVHGLAINAMSSLTTGSTAWNIITSSFDVDPSVIELFPSLEQTSTGGALGSSLKATPVLIYRLKPFIFKSVEATAPQAINEVSTHPFIDSKVIDSQKIISLSLFLTEDNRINAIYINTPLSQSKGVETFGLVGNPVLDSNDIAYNGLKLYKVNYPFFPVGRKQQNTLAQDVDYVIKQASQILLNSHKYFQGSATLLYDGSITAGTWLHLQIRSNSNLKDLLVYVEKVEHSINVTASNVIQSRTSIRFTRAFYASNEP